jgi:peroxisomal enoyl-CoA hydratase 2
MHLGWETRIFGKPAVCEVLTVKQVYTRSVGSAFMMGQGNWGGPKGPGSVNFPPPKDRKPDAVDEQQLSAEAALLYR